LGAAAVGGSLPPASLAHSTAPVAVLAEQTEAARHKEFEVLLAPHSLQVRSF
jgi:hypothetical protein